MYTLLGIIIFVLHHTVIQAAQVIGGNVTVAQGGNIVFPCVLTESADSLTQITWQRRTRLIKKDTNFFTISSTGPLYFNGPEDRFSFVGNFALRNGSLQLSNVTKSDEGTYTCIVTLFPSGNFKTEIPLNVLVSPETSTKNNFLIIGNEEVELASCTATHSWPPSKLDWHLGEHSNLLRITQNSTVNADGTTTTISTLFGIPTRNLHNLSIQCVIKNPALPDVTTLPLTIQIHFPPSEVRIKATSQNTFECVSEANPRANFTWSSRSTHSWPESAVKANGAVLQIIKPSPELNGLFECKATNEYGTTRGHLYLHLRVEGSGTAGWILFCLLLFVIAAAIAIWCYRSGKKCDIPWFNTSRNEETTRDVTPRTDVPEERQPEEVPLRSRPDSPELS